MSQQSLSTTAVIRESAEVRFADELQRLTLADKDNPKPQGWLRSPRAVRRFILGDDELKISQKFFGDDALIDRAIVTLLGRQGLMLVGEPGTAKSMLSELFAAAISGDSGLTIQGTAGTTEDHIKYSWNYALLLAEGPTQRALVSSPLYQGMVQGKMVRFEEITRCPPEIQDVLVSLMSEKQMMIPEMGEGARVSACPGFNLIATANLRDRGVHEMSAALKRRFNFETVRPIQDPAFEIELINMQLKRELGDLTNTIAIPENVIELLVTTFQELRSGNTRDGGNIQTPDAVMSSAEAVNIAYACALEAHYLGDGVLNAGAVARQLIGVVLKDNADDIKRIRYYMDNVARERARHSDVWKAFFNASKEFWR
ncbi:ATP-binding protein [Serratia oryzae]|uniref:AAA family ATPase n=1 Tax=Serratia oryzae TaxID=2034155 RepID=A0A1S8CMR6_9GAMM|nr:AAA family ATPase [Serratia oryzae]OMQ25488.1 AAA family ATPase [Serratia oryzae]VXC54735.1 putative ABC superfamily protein [Enterobacterales bacterium 8AC]